MDVSFRCESFLGLYRNKKNLFGSFLLKVGQGILWKHFLLTTHQFLHCRIEEKRHNGGLSSFFVLNWRIPTSSLFFWPDEHESRTEERKMKKVLAEKKSHDDKFILYFVQHVSRIREVRSVAGKVSTMWQKSPTRVEGTAQGCPYHWRSVCACGLDKNQKGWKIGDHILLPDGIFMSLFGNASIWWRDFGLLLNRYGSGYLLHYLWDTHYSF